MSKRIRDLNLLLGAVIGMGSLVGACAADARDPVDTVVATASAPQAAAACALPSVMARTNEETAWQLFANASCPVNGKPGWELWTEQSCLKAPASCATGSAHHLHASGLAQLRAGAVVAPPGNCGPMLTAAVSPPPSLIPFIPKNLSANPTFCEEVFVNDAEAAFVRAPAPGASLTTKKAQASYIASRPGGLQFPTAAVEIKVDWLPAASVNGAFDCKTNPPPGVYVEVIDNACYALVSVHIESKLLKNWLWATFEPQNPITNPNRCNPSLYNACNDPWGSVPPSSTGALTQRTPALIALMQQTGIQGILSGYRLVAAQSDFLDSTGAPSQLGNSFTEFNAGVAAGTASCITCHAYAQLTTRAVENDNIGGPPLAPIGFPSVLPPPPNGDRWLAQDFSWMLGIMN